MDVATLAKYRQAQRANTIHVFERSLTGYGVERDLDLTSLETYLQDSNLDLQNSVTDTDCPYPSLSFRELVDVLRRDGNLVEIDDFIDPSVAISERDFEFGDDTGKAFLFNNAPGMNDGFFRLLGIPYSLRYHPHPNDQIVASDAGTGASLVQESLIKEQTEEYTDIVSPTELSEASCKKNRFIANQINLTAVPTLLNYRVNGARLIELHGLLVTNIPMFEMTTWRMIVARVSGHNQLKFSLSALAQANQTVSDLEEALQHIPCSLCFGVEPAVITAASSPLSNAEIKAKYVGIIAGRPLTLVKSETNSLLIPASSEIVFEGALKIPNNGNGSRRYSRSRKDSISCRDVEVELTIHMITYRDQPIMPVPIGGDTDE